MSKIQKWARARRTAAHHTAALASAKIRRLHYRRGGIRSYNAASRGWLARIGIILGVTFAGRFLGFLFPLLVLRQLSTGRASLAYFYINSAYFVVQPVSGGVAQAMVRPIVSSTTAAERLRWCRASVSTLRLGMVLAGLFGLVECLTASAPFVPMVLMVVGLSVDAFYFQMLTARQRYVQATVYRLIANAVQLAALVAVLLARTHSVTAIVAIFALSYAAGIAAVEPRERVLVGLATHAARSSRSQRRALMRAAVPTGLTGLAYAGITGLDTYLVRLSNPALVAGYGAAKTLAAPFLLVSLAIAPVVQPETAHVTARRAMEIRGRILGVAASAGVFVVAACWLLASPAVEAVYGGRYPEAAATLRWLGPGALILGLYALLQAWCWGCGWYRLPLVSLGTGAIVAISCNRFLVPRVGAPGAGAAFCAGAGVAMAMLIVLTRGAKPVVPLGDRDAGTGLVTAASGEM